VEIAKVLLDRGAKPNSESRVNFSVIFASVLLCVFDMNRCILSWEEMHSFHNADFQHSKPFGAKCNVIVI